MTRETKIGLLVGLAFVIVIGILISDQITRSTEPPQAALGGAGNGVRQAVGSPGTSGEPAPVAVVTPVVTPQQPVATQGELTNPAPAVQIVKIGGPQTPAPQPAPQVVPQTMGNGNSANAQATGATAVVGGEVSQSNAPQNDTPVVTQVANPPAATDSELSKVAELIERDVAL
jgi:hypothetical protein